MRFYSGMGVPRVERTPMRKFLAVTAMLLIVSAAPEARADDATNLCVANC
jgi:hypothetical protein